MRRRIGIALPTALLVLALAEAVQAAPLTAKQQTVLDYLVENWGRDTAVTGIDLAMEILGGDYTADDRYALGLHMREHPEVHRVVRMFGWETVALTPTEKRIARALSRAEQEQRPAPALEQLARNLELPSAVVTDALDMLERFGIVRRVPAAGGVGYRMAKSRYVNWEGGMRITFTAHRVNVHGLKQLDTY